MATTHTVKSGETLNSIAKQYGFKNYKEAGITAVPSGNFDLVRVGDAITIGAYKAPAPQSPAQVKDNSSAAAFINSQQDNDMSRASALDEPPTRKRASETLTEAYKDLTGKSSLLPEGGAPELPQFEMTYNQLRSQYNVDQLESTLNDLNAEETAIRQQKRERLQSEEDKPVALNVISGRQTEVERQENKRLESVAVQKAGIAAQLQTANSVIQNTMNLKSLDYNAAKGAYDSAFSQNLQLFNVIKGLYDADVTEEERIADNARANLQIIYGNLKDSPDTEVSSDLAYTINKLELEAGLPKGFYSRIQAEKPESKVLSTTTRTSGGTKYADVLYQNGDGSLSTKTVNLGATNEGSGGGADISEAELERGARSSIVKTLDPVRGGDGYVSPDDYKKARSAWISAGFARDSFDKAFAAEYVNPDSYTALGVDYVFY